jgi:hypothetical protein
MMNLGSMGLPKTVDVNGRPVLICCESCRESLLENPKKYLDILASTDTKKAKPNKTQMDLPPIGLPTLIEPQGNLPPIGIPQLIQEVVPTQEDPQDYLPARVTGQNKEVVR